MQLESNVPCNLYEEFMFKKCVKNVIIDSVALLSWGKTTPYQQEMFHSILLKTNMIFSRLVGTVTWNIQFIFISSWGNWSSRWNDFMRQWLNYTKWFLKNNAAGWEWRFGVDILLSCFLFDFELPLAFHNLGSKRCDSFLKHTSFNKSFLCHVSC